MEHFGKFCLGVLILFLSAIVSGFVFMTLWGWFIIPKFTLPDVNLAESIGLMIFVSFLKYKSKDGTKDDKPFVKDILESFAKQIVLGSFVLLFGWIITTLL
jgi:hypothetical protein